MEENKADLQHTTSREDILRRIQTAESVFLPRDVFEALYLNPERKVAGDLRKKFGNPTPVALIGFVMSATPYSCASMGWRGAGGQGGAILTVMIFFGGLLQLLASIGEWILGNTFSTCIFFTYGTFWIVAGTSLQPFFGIGAEYSPTGNSFEGATTPAFYATYGFYYLSLALLTTIFWVCSIRTNMLLFSALFLLIFAFGCAAGAFWQLALGHVDLGQKLTIAAGAFTFALTMIVWYLLLVQLLEAVDFPISLPVGDLSGFVPGNTERAEKKKNRDHED